MVLMQFTVQCHRQNFMVSNSIQHPSVPFADNQRHRPHSERGFIWSLGHRHESGLGETRHALPGRCWPHQTAEGECSAWLQMLKARLRAQGNLVFFQQKATVSQTGHSNVLQVLKGQTCQKKVVDHLPHTRNVATSAVDKSDCWCVGSRYITSGLSGMVVPCLARVFSVLEQMFCTCWPQLRS